MVHVLLATLVLMSGWQWAVEVGILPAKQATMFVVCMDLCWCDVVPLVGHDLLDVATGERTALSDRFFPVMKEGVVERRHAFCRLGRHLDDVEHVSASFSKCFKYSLLVVDASAIDDQSQRRIVQCSGLLTQRVENAIDEHLRIDASDSTARSIFGRVDGWRKHLIAIDASDHVEALRIGGGVLHHHPWLLTWRHESRSGSLTHTQSGLVQEEDTRLAHLLKLAT